MFDALQNGLIEFFKKPIDLMKSEYLIPDVVFDEIKNHNKKVKVLESTDKWLGVTYKEDKEHVVEEIKKLIEKGEYPNDLWQ